MTKATQSPTARSVIAYVDRYLAYCHDEEAKEWWTLAIAKATQGGLPLHTALWDICRTYLYHATQRSEAP